MLEKKSSRILMREYLGHFARRGPQTLKPSNRELRGKLKRALELPSLPKLDGAIVGVTMVKNEEDIIGKTANHLLNQGVDHLIVADNLSSDGTLEILLDLAKSGQVSIAIDSEPAYYQAEKMSNLSQAATKRGAKWIIPFDADEYWFAEAKSLGRFFRESKGEVFHAMVHNAFPDPYVDGDTLWVSEKTEFQPKTAFKRFPLAGPTMGNHWANRPGNNESGLHIVHYPWRTLAQLQSKASTGTLALKLASADKKFGTQWKNLSTVSDAHLGQVWHSIVSRQPDEALGLESSGPFQKMNPLSMPHWTNY
ncbi:glycosyltransferase family 2 protein [Neomicrococcus lactis]|uniref:glycosyltransferase family 2 protein n=1 Tax=Neomicrococcus lactis TaxID=732241 RepID=UPI002301DB40|nr:glycosyltransferase family 2 protein [Neomicrococcus lactis]